MTNQDEEHYVFSPVFNKKYLVANNDKKVEGINCPIDGTQLISSVEDNSYAFDCLACGARYQWGDKDLDSLKQQAKFYIMGVSKRLAELKAEEGKLEVIVKAAKIGGVI